MQFQASTGVLDGGAAVPDRNPATVLAAPWAARGTGTVEPAADPAESRPVAAGDKTRRLPVCW